MLTLEGVGRGDLLVIPDEGEIFSPPVGDTSGQDGQPEHAQAQISDVGLHAREHVSKAALERGEAHQEQHDTERENDGRAGAVVLVVVASVAVVVVLHFVWID